MKSAFAAVCLSFLSANALSAEPAAAAPAAPAAVAATGEACMTPRIPPFSTNTREEKDVMRDIQRWKDCVVAQPTEDNLRRHAVVDKNVSEWRAATSRHFRAERALGSSAIDKARDDRDRNELARNAESARLADLNRNQ